MAADILNLNEKRLERLPPRQLAGELMRLPAKRRQDIILERDDSQAVTTAMDANDFFFTIQEIGPDDALPMLALAGTSQLDHLFDIEWWRKDSIEPARALAWLERLDRASGRKLVEWLYHADFELLVTLFKQFVTVAVAPDDVDLIEARDNLPPRTIDDVFFWEALYPQYDELVTGLLTLIYEANYNFFKELLNQVLFAPTIEMEELAYQFHKARLSENAIPDYYEALEIYSATKPDDFRAIRPRSTEEGEHSPPAFALALVRDEDLLGRVLRQIDDPALAESLKLETASLANKVIVADQLPPESADALRFAVDKTLAYVNLGLELKSGGTVDSARKWIGDTFLENFFRLAQAEVAGIAARLRAVLRQGWLARCPSGVKCLDGKWFDAAEELLGKTPKLYKQREEGAPGGTPRADVFRTPEDLARAGHLVDVIGAAGYLYDALGTGPGPDNFDLWPEGQVRAAEDITLGVMVFTAAAGFLASREWRVEPLSVEGWTGLFPVLDPAGIERALMEWTSVIIDDREKKALAREYLAPILRDYEAEMRPFSAANPPEPQLVPFFMFQARR